MSFYGEVRATEELARIASMPRRAISEKPDDPHTAALVAQMTAIFRLQLPLNPPDDPDPRTRIPRTLLPIQAWALHDIAAHKGCFSLVRVGGGKTLLSLLASFALGAKRTLLLVPGAHLHKTKLAIRRYSAWWRISPNIRVESYQAMGRAGAIALYDAFAPDAVIADEAHKLRNKQAAVTKRLLRYCSGAATRGAPVSCVFMSGTFTKRSLRDYHHLVGLALHRGMFLPATWHETDMWAKCIDERRGEDATMPRPNPTHLVRALVTRADFDALKEPVPSHPEETPTHVLRHAYRRRMVETAGVIATSEGFEGPSLNIRCFRIHEDKAVHDAFWHMRTYYEFPDGYPLAEGVEAAQMWALAQALSNGFYYQVEPRPPKEWLARLRAWGSFVRSVTSDPSLRLDSEKMVALACAQGKLDPTAYNAWREIRPTFEPKSQPVFLSKHVLQYAARWLKKHGAGSMVWCKHLAFGRALAELADVPFFEGGGRCLRTRRYVEDYNGPAVASIDANGTGMNLQAYHRSLVLNVTPNGSQMEQLLGRTHRPGQPEDEVTYEFGFTCVEDEQSFEQCFRDARYLETSTGQAQKLLYATLTMPEKTLIGNKSPVWCKDGFGPDFQDRTHLNKDLES